MKRRLCRNPDPAGLQNAVINFYAAADRNKIAKRKDTQPENIHDIPEGKTDGAANPDIIYECAVPAQIFDEITFPNGADNRVSS